MEDFHEADVLWPEGDLHNQYFKTSQVWSGTPPKCRDAGTRSNSAPIRIPTTPGRRSPPGSSRAAGRARSVEQFYRSYDDASSQEPTEDVDGGARDEVVPPHVLVARRCNGKVAFSLCSGHGRTLKGRDLSRVRNSVLRLTGFLEGDGRVDFERRF